MEGLLVWVIGRDAESGGMRKEDRSAGNEKKLRVSTGRNAAAAMPINEYLYGYRSDSGEKRKN